MREGQITERERDVVVSVKSSVGVRSVSGKGKEETDVVYTSGTVLCGWDVSVRRVKRKERDGWIVE